MYLLVPSSFLSSSMFSIPIVLVMCSFPPIRHRCQRSLSFLSEYLNLVFFMFLAFFQSFSCTSRFSTSCSDLSCSFESFHPVFFFLALSSFPFLPFSPPPPHLSTLLIPSLFSFNHPPPSPFRFLLSFPLH